MHKRCLITNKRNILFFAIWLFVTIADQLSKLWIRTNFALGQSIPETGFFRFTYVQNTGAAFSIFSGNNEVLAVIAALEGLVVLIIFFFIIKRLPQWNTPYITISLALIMGGIAGNLIDRFNLGYVTDFIDVGPWPVFNIADSSGVIGVIMLAVYIILISRGKKHEKG